MNDARPCEFWDNLTDRSLRDQIPFGSIRPGDIVHYVSTGRAFRAVPAKSDPEGDWEWEYLGVFE